ncbi:MAG: hypothetical protein A2Z20_01370 [Bdellovibrionales bacterium RBG_16_40_8]|nr:MAG: hypothetical protein A2Z20_01370 [Bdellovibrionales bacterium RBG_16_40_8]
MGMAQRFAVDTMLVRMAWIFSFLFFGVGLGVYCILAICLPRDDKLAASYNSRIMGVCSRFARRFDLDVGLTRVGFLTLLILSGGVVFLAYVVLYYILPSEHEFKNKSGYTK